MAGLAGVARRNVRAWLGENRGIDTRRRMTLNAIVREPAVKVVRRGTGSHARIRIQRRIVERHDQSDRTGARESAGAHHELDRVRAGLVRHERRARRVRVHQGRAAARRPRDERPCVAQRSAVGRRRLAAVEISRVGIRAVVASQRRRRAGVGFAFQERLADTSCIGAQDGGRARRRVRCAPRRRRIARGAAAAAGDDQRDRQRYERDRRLQTDLGADRCHVLSFLPVRCVARVNSDAGHASRCRRVRGALARPFRALWPS